MSWYDERTLDVGDNEKLNPFWHCFGANACAVNRDTVLAMLRASRTALLPLNTHGDHWASPIIGNGDVRWNDVQHLPLVQNRVPRVPTLGRDSHPQSALAEGGGRGLCDSDRCREFLLGSLLRHFREHRRLDPAELRDRAQHGHSRTRRQRQCREKSTRCRRAFRAVRCIQDIHLCPPTSLRCLNGSPGID